MPNKKGKLNSNDMSVGRHIARNKWPSMILDMQKIQPTGEPMSTAKHLSVPEHSRYVKNMIPVEKKVLVKKEIESILNSHSIDNDLGIPDFMLSDMIMRFIEEQAKFHNQLTLWETSNQV